VGEEQLNVSPTVAARRYCSVLIYRSRPNNRYDAIEKAIVESLALLRRRSKVTLTLSHEDKETEIDRIWNRTIHCDE